MNRLEKFKVFHSEYYTNNNKITNGEKILQPLTQKEIDLFGDFSIRLYTSAFISYPYKNGFIDLYIDKVEDNYYYIFLELSSVGDCHFYKLDQFSELNFFIKTIKTLENKFINF